MSDISEWKAVFDRLEAEISSRLSAQGYVKTKHDYHPNLNGTAYSVYSHDSGHVRLTWDGKTETMILRKYRKGSAVIRTLKTAFLGRHDVDKLELEVVAKAFELRSSADEQWISRFTEKL